MAKILIKGNLEIHGSITDLCSSSIYAHITAGWTCLDAFDDYDMVINGHITTGDIVLNGAEVYVTGHVHVL